MRTAVGSQIVSDKNSRSENAAATTSDFYSLFKRCEKRLFRDKKTWTHVGIWWLVLYKFDLITTLRKYRYIKSVANMLFRKVLTPNRAVRCAKAFTSL